MFLPQTGRSRSAQFLVGTPFRQGPGLGTRGACPPAWPHAVSLTVGTARTPQASRPGLDSQPQLPVEQGAGYWLRSGVGLDFLEENQVSVCYQKKESRHWIPNSYISIAMEISISIYLPTSTKK